MRPRFLVEPEAEAELEEAFAWYEGRVTGLGSEFTRMYALSSLRSVEILTSFARVRNDIRRALVRRFPYAVYYVAESEQIAVIAVVHTRRHPRRWQSRR